MSAFHEKESPHRLLGSFLIIPVMSGILATAVLAPALMRRGDRDSVSLRYWNADRAAMVAAERWVISAERDSLADWVRTVRTAADSLVVRVDAGVPPAVAAMAESMLRIEWEASGPHASDARVLAVIALDTARVAGALKRPRERLPRYVMPWRLDQKSCVAVIRITRDVAADPKLLATGAMSTGMSPASLGPCAFVGALGLPGTGARQWLESAGSSHATRADWWRERTAITPDSSSMVTAAIERPSTRESKAYQNRVVEAVRSPRVASCREGNEASCRAVVDPASFNPDERRSVVRPEDGLLAPQGVLMPSVRLFHAGTYGSLLSDLVRDVGREKVATAWRGDAPFMDAVAEGAGTTSSALGAAWVRRNLPAVSEHDASLTPSAILVPFVLSLVLLALALVTARRRERV